MTLYICDVCGVPLPHAARYCHDCDRGLVACEMRASRDGLVIAIVVGAMTYLVIPHGGVVFGACMIVWVMAAGLGANARAAAFRHARRLGAPDTVK